MFRVILFSTAVVCFSEGFPQSNKFLQQGGRTNRKLSSFVKQYYANIKDVDRFSLKGRSSLSTGLGSNEYGNIVEKTRKQTNALKKTLRKLAANPSAAQYMKKTFQVGDCVKTVEEAIAAIENGASIIEGAEPQLTKLISTLSGLDDSSDIIEVTKTSVDVLRQMETLMPKLAPANPDICGSSFEVAFETLQTVGDVLNEISEDNLLELSRVTRLELKISREIVVSANIFLKKLRQNFSDLDANCTSDKGYNVRALKAMGSMLNDLADLFRELGDQEGEKEIREKTKFADKIAATIKNFPVADVGGLDCNNPGDFETTARMLEDLVNLIEEVGIDKLKNQLGLQELF